MKMQGQLRKTMENLGKPRKIAGFATRAILAALPTAVSASLRPFLPESPRWLLKCCVHAAAPGQAYAHSVWGPGAISI